MINGSRDATMKRSTGRPGSGGCELPVGAGEVERALGMVDEHAPAVGADQPLDRPAGAVRLELVAALTIAHAIDLPFAVELRPTLPEAEQRSLRQQEGHVRRLGVECQPLDEHAVGRLDMEGGRLGGEAHGQVAGADRLERLCRSSCRDTLGRRRLRHAPIVWHCG